METSSLNRPEEDRAIVSRTTPASGTASWRVLHPVSQLCAFCQNLPEFRVESFWDLVKEFGKISERRTFLSLETSAEAGCVVCQLNWNRSINGLLAIDREEKEPFNAHLSLVEVAVLGDYLNICIFRNHETSARRPEIRLNRTKKSDLTWRDECRKVKSLTKGSSVADLRSMVDEEILPWLHSCKAQQPGHEDCSRTETDGIIPKRLIQVSKLQDDMVKLIETTKIARVSNIQYLILSYCWGQGNSRARTTKNNLEQRLNGFTTQMLPQTIRDAIALTKLMQFEFLWVDAICIVQSSEGDVGDFEDEAPKMKDYYANATCCISASMASDSSQGLFHERLDSKFPFRQVVLEQSDTSNTQISPEIFEVAQEDSGVLRNAIKGSPLMERGWCMQELLLSRRILHWTVRGLFRECQTSMFLEGSSRPWEEFRHPYGYFPIQYPRKIIDVRRTESFTSENWYRILESFSERQLTFLQDRHFAIQGIATLFMQYIKGEYTHGIFRSSLIQGLSWAACTPGTEHETNSQDLDFPTWSWASSGQIYIVPISTPCPVLYEDVQMRTAMRDAIGGFSDVEANRKDESLLFIKAPLIPVKVSATSYGHTAEISHKRIDHTALFMADCTLDCNRRVGLFRSPRVIETLQLGVGHPDVTVQWLPLEITKGSSHVGLMLERLSTGDRETFFRYGCLTIGDSSVGNSLSEFVESFYDTLTDIILV